MPRSLFSGIGLCHSLIQSRVFLKMLGTFLPLLEEGSPAGYCTTLNTVKFGQKNSPFSNHNLLPLKMHTLGDWIKAKRIGKKLTLGHLAAKMGIALTLICSWEGGTSRPNNEQIQDLIKIFGEAPLLGIVS